MQKISTKTLTGGGIKVSMNDVKISVIIPVYNAEKYLKRSLDSVCNQTLRELEILLINDESTDSSLEICQQYANKDNRIRIYNKKNEGAGIARNLGLKYAKGDYIAFLDADDYIKNSMYNILYNRAIADYADACMCGYYKVGMQGEILKKFIPDKDELYTSNEEVISEVLFNILGADCHYHTDVILGTSVWKTIFKRSVLIQRGILFLSERKVTSEDTLFNIDFFSEAARVSLVAKPLYMYCVNTESLSRKFRQESFAEIKRLYLIEKEHLDKIRRKQEALERIERSFLGNTRTVLAQAVMSQKPKEAMDYINKVCNDKELIKVLEHYPYQHNPKKIRLFNQLLKGKKIFLLWNFLKIYLLKGNIH